MGEIRSWSDPPAGMLAGGLAVVPDAADRIAALQSPERRAAKAAFDEAWSETIALQKALRDRSPGGVIIDVPDTRPEFLRRMDAAALVRPASHATFVPAPGGGTMPAKAAAVEAMRESAAPGAQARAVLYRSWDRGPGPCKAVGSVRD